MNITTILLDLDGTLLPMDQNEFTNKYFKLLCKKMLNYGYDPKELTEAIWKGTYAMIKNNSSESNEIIFWNCFAGIFGERVMNDKKYFDEFYRNEFNNLRSSCGYNPEAAKIVRKFKSMGLKVILATNPIFPAEATESRIKWTGLEPDDFEFYTTYENISGCKPNLRYYRNIMDRFALSPRECIMVGNDVTEDMAAKELGMNVFLVTDCLINKNNEDINKFPHGNLEQMGTYILSDKTII